MNLRSIDLNLLVVLRTLLETRHVSRAAIKLNMSQPAASRALQRLRKLFGDPLMVRARQGFDLSARGRELLPELQRLLADIDRIVSEPEFDPATTQRRVRMCGPGLEIIGFMPRIVAATNEMAPGLFFDVHSDPGDYFARLENDEADFAILGLQPKSDTNLYRLALLPQTPHTCLMRRDHPLARGPLTLSRYLKASHGVVALTGEGPNMMDLKLEAMGKTRHVALRLSSLSSVPYYAATTDVLFSLPGMSSLSPVMGENLILKPMPKELRDEGFQSYLYWHARSHDDPMCRWLRQTIHDVVTS